MAFSESTAIASVSAEQVDDSSLMRAQVLATVLSWFSAGVLLVGALMAIQSLVLGTINASLVIAIAGIQLIVVLKLAQRRLGFHFTARAFLIHLLVTIGYLQCFCGLTAGSIFAGVAVMLLSGLFFGKRGVIWAFALLLCSLALSSWIAMNAGTVAWDQRMWSSREPLVWIRYTFVLICFGGGVASGLLLTIQNLEQTAVRLSETLVRERAERAQRQAVQGELEKAKRLEAMGQFAAGMAHDFNNSLMVIMAGADVIASDPDASQELVTCANEIVERTRIAGETVKQLLSLGRDDTGNRSAVKLDAVLRRSMPTLQQALGEQVQCALDCSSHAVVSVDVGRFQQALLNLAVNARDAMPDGGRWSLSVAERTFETIPPGWTAQPGRYVAVECGDTGTGLDAALVDKIFEPFFTTKDVGKGTGLGLAMVRKAILDARGFIEVESALGVGTTFRLVLPTESDGTAHDRIPKARSNGGGALSDAAEAQQPQR